MNLGQTSFKSNGKKVRDGQEMKGQILHLKLNLSLRTQQLLKTIVKHYTTANEWVFISVFVGACLFNLSDKQRTYLTRRQINKQTRVNSGSVKGLVWKWLIKPTCMLFQVNKRKTDRSFLFLKIKQKFLMTHVALQRILSNQYVSTMTMFIFVQFNCLYFFAT